MKKTCTCGTEMIVEPHKSGLKVIHGCYLMYHGNLRFKVPKPKTLIQSAMCSNCLKHNRLKTFQ